MVIFNSYVKLPEGIPKVYSYNLKYDQHLGKNMRSIQKTPQIESVRSQGCPHSTTLGQVLQPVPLQMKKNASDLGNMYVVMSTPDFAKPRFIN